MVVDELVGILGFEIKGQEKLRQFNQSIETAARRVTMFAAAAATAAAGAAVMLGKSVISTSAEFEGYAATLETIEGSSEKARKALDWVAEFGKTTPYEVGEVTQAFVRLKAYGLDPMDGTLSAVGDAASAMGKGLMQGVEAIADAATGEFERLKEFGIKSKQAGDKVTFTWSQNGKELTKTVKKSSTEIVKFLKENFGQRFSGAMLRQSKTWNGMMSNLGDSWVDFQRRIGEGGFFEAVKSKLAGVLDYIAKLDADGTLDRWSRNLATAFTAASDIIGNLAVRIGRHVGTIAEIIERNKGAWEWLKWVLGALALRLFPITALLAVAALALDDFLTYMRGGQSVIGDFVKSLSDLMGADPDAVAEALTGLGLAAGGLSAAAGFVTGFSTAMFGLAAALAAVFGGYKLAKIAFDYLDQREAEISGIKAAENPKAKPGYIESGGYDEDGKFIYMDGNRRVDKPTVNTTAGFTDEALDYKLLLQNLEGNLAKTDAGNAAASIDQTVNDSRNQSVNVEVGGVTVNGVPNATGAVGAAVGSAIGNSAAGAAKLPPTRTVGSGAF